MSHRRLATVLLVSTVLFPAVASAAKKITINLEFNSSGKVTDSDGAKINTAAAGLTATQQDDIRKKVKEKYEDVYGAGNVTINVNPLVGPPANADQTVIITNTTAPGKEYGDAGAKNGPAIVYLKQFTDNGFKLDKVANYIGETAAHEVGHKLGVAHNGEDNTLMSQGSNVTRAKRAADARSFTAAEAKKILDNTKDPGGAKKDAPMSPAPGGKAPLGWNTGHNPLPAPPDPDASPAPTADYTGPGFDYEDDGKWNAAVSLSPALAPHQFQVGYINADGEFFKLADPFASFVDGSTDTVASFGGLGSLHSTADLALFDPVTSLTYDYSSYGTDISYSTLNPYNSSVFLQALIGFQDFGFGSVALAFDARDAATGEFTTGGFTPVPTPTAAAAGVVLLTATALVSRRRTKPLA